MTDDNEDMEKRLARLREATDSIAPGSGFTSKVMARLSAEEGGWFKRIPSLWQHTLPIAVLLAMISTFWAYRNACVADARIAAATDSEDPMEMDW